MGAAKKSKIQRPNIYEHHDYVEFLNAWFEYLKTTGSRKSPRAIGLRAGLSTSYLQKVLTRGRSLSEKALEKVSPYLELNKAEISFLGHLRNLAEATSQDERQEAYKKIKKFALYQNANADNLEAHKYLKAWYYTCIREMSHMSGFQFDAQWIQKRLKYHVSISDIEECLRFLIDKGYIVLDDKGQVVDKGRPISCDGGVFRLSMANFHKQILELGIESIFDTPRSQRYHTAHTMSIPKSNFEAVHEILNGALAQIQELSQGQDHSDDAEKVFQVSLMAFPLSKEGGNA